MKAVVFDMDGVIFDSETLVIQMWKVVAEKYGIEDIEATCRECLGTNAAVSKEKFFKFDFIISSSMYIFLNKS